MTQKEYSILYRSYGNQLPHDLWPALIPNVIDRFHVLTTVDSDIEGLSDQGVDVITPIYTSQEAGVNSAAILNQGLEYLNKRGESHALFVASGYQSSLPEISRALNYAINEKPDRDIYFFVTPDLHSIQWDQLNSAKIDHYALRRDVFPSESLTLVTINEVFPLDESLTRKGNLGSTEDGIPLGGLELLLTMLNKYSSTGKTWMPRMCGIYTPFIYRSAGTFQIADDRFPGSFYSFPEPVEYTSKDLKDRRRELTIDRGLVKMDLTKEDYNILFEHTEYIKFKI